MYGRLTTIIGRWDDFTQSFESVIRERLTSDPVSSEQLENLSISKRYANAYYTTAEGAEAGMALLIGSKRATYSLLDAMNDYHNPDQGEQAFFSELSFPLYDRHEKNCIEIPRTCLNGEVDGDETDIDCGGSCLPCDVNQSCLVDDDCSSGPCKPFGEGMFCWPDYSGSFANFQMYSSIGMILLGLLLLIAV